VAENRFKTSTEKRLGAAAPAVPQAPPGVTAEPRDQGADQRADQRADEAAGQASAQVAGRAPYRANDRISDPIPGETPDRRRDPTPDPTLDPSTDPARLRQNQGRWKLSFSLFLLGFMLLIVGANKNLPTGETWVFRGVAAVLCVGAFFLARQAQRHSKAQRPKA
jgi:hypothetical protein